MEKPIEEITLEEVRNFFRHLSERTSGHAANKARKNLGAAWRWGEYNMERWPHSPNLFLATERFKEAKSQRYVPPEEDFWRVYDLAEGQDQIMLLAFFHLGARRNELFNLKWSNVDFERRQVYLQTRKRDGGLEGDWVPMTLQLYKRLREWSTNGPSIPGMDKKHLFIKYRFLWRLLWKAISEKATFYGKALRPGRSQTLRVSFNPAFVRIQALAPKCFSGSYSTAASA